MNRILLVDDAPDVLSDLTQMLVLDGEWTVRTATSSADALVALADAPADIVVADMRMPGMDGAELLLRVQTDYPRCVRILLAEHDDENAARCAMSVAHQLIPKPCQVDVLFNVLDRVRDLRQLLANEALQTLVGRMRNLPTRPLTYLALSDSLIRPSVSVAGITEIVERDPGIASRVLQVANSAFFGMHRQVTELQDAVSHIGFATLHSLVAACEVLGGFDKQKNALGGSVDPYECARLARFIGRRTQHGDAFTAALLRDVGLYVLRDDERGAAMTEAPHATRHLAERDTFGFDHAEIGAYLLAMWGLPVSLVRGVLYHPAPYTEPVPGLTTAGVVWFAESLLRDLTLDEERAVAEYAESLDLDGELEDWRDEAATILTDRRAAA